MPLYRYQLTLLLTLLSGIGVAQAYDAVDIAVVQEGDQYLWGYEGPDDFDCSGLTQYAYRHVGIALRRTASEYTDDNGVTYPGQDTEGTPVTQRTVGSNGLPNEMDFSKLRRGDLLFFANSSAEAQQGQVGHVGIFVGGTTMVNAYVDEGVVVEDLKDPRTNSNGDNWYWKSIFLQARRLPTPPGPSTKFSIGDRVEATEDGVNIRDAARDWAAKRGQTTAGRGGAVQALPMFFNGYWYWQINFDSGTDGWVAEDYLRPEGTSLAFTYDEAVSGDINNYVVAGHWTGPTFNFGVGLNEVRATTHYTGINGSPPGDVDWDGFFFSVPAGRHLISAALTVSRPRLVGADLTSLGFSGCYLTQNYLDASAYLAVQGKVPGLPSGGVFCADTLAVAGTSISLWPDYLPISAGTYGFSFGVFAGGLVSIGSYFGGTWDYVVSFEVR